MSLLRFLGLGASSAQAERRETQTVRRIAEELGFTRPEANALRSAYKDKLSEFQ